MKTRSFGWQGSGSAAGATGATGSFGATGATGSVGATGTSSNIQTSNQTLYVAKTGSDADLSRAAHLGLIGNPFLTIEAAVNAAISGDFIYVFSGTYNITAVDGNGIAKDGIKYEFELGCDINKSTSGSLFNIDGFTIGFEVTGYANFNMSGSANYITVGTFNFTLKFQSNDCLSTSSPLFYLGNGGNTSKSYISVHNAITSAGECFSLLADCVLNANIIKSTSASAIVVQSGLSNNGRLLVNALLVESTTSVAITGFYYVIASLNVANISGVGYGISVTTAGDVNLNGHTSGVYNNGGDVNISRTSLCGNIRVLSGNLNGGRCFNLNVSSGFVNDITLVDYFTSSITVSGGVVYADISQQTYTASITCSGGKLFLSGYNNGVLTYGNRDINGGTVICDCDFTISNNYVNEQSIFQLSSGTLILNDGRFINNAISAFAAIVKWTGGNLIVNGATMITGNADTPPIISASPSQTLRVYSAGMTTNRTQNGGTLSAKIQKDKITITAVADTSIILDDGSGAEGFLALAVGFPTKALLAQQMVVLINASATLDITASQDAIGVDDYFYIESDIAGAPYVESSLVNLTVLHLRLNSYLMTNIITGSSIIEDADVI